MEAFECILIGSLRRRREEDRETEKRREGRREGGREGGREREGGGGRDERW